MVEVYGRHDMLEEYVEVYDGRCMKIYLTKNILVSGVI